MPARQKLELRKIHPLRSFSLILAVLFTIESLVMFLLPTIVPTGSSPPAYAFIDACLLTCVLAPMLWLMIVNPLQRLASTRQRLLALHLSSLESERHRIALDLHDGLGQSLTVLTVGLRTIEETSTESAVQAQARELRRIGGNTHDELRRLVHGMRPAVLDDLGLIPALERFVGDLNVSNCIEARLQVHCVAAVNLCEEVQISVFRMVQEAATNAIRHGNARQLTIKMNCDALTLNIEIEDDGIGFDTAKNLNSDQTGSNLGLLSVHERACLLGGEAMVSSSPGAGTQVRVQVPLRRKDSMNE